MNLQFAENIFCHFKLGPKQFHNLSAKTLLCYQHLLQNFLHLFAIAVICSSSSDAASASSANTYIFVAEFKRHRTAYGWHCYRLKPTWWAVEHKGRNEVIKALGKLNWLPVPLKNVIKLKIVAILILDISNPRRHYAQKTANDCERSVYNNEWKKKVGKICSVAKEISL